VQPINLFNNIAYVRTVKRKWERIVSRGFTSLHNPAPSLSPSPSPSSSSSAAYSYFASHSASASSAAAAHPTPGTSLGTAALSALEPTNANAAVLDGIREGVQGVGRSIIAALSASHSPSSSLSTLATASTSTSTSTKSTRFSLSQSLQSSLGEEPPLTPDLSAGEVDGVQVQVLDGEGDGEGEGDGQLIWSE
jgi:hypothetical protein